MENIRLWEQTPDYDPSLGQPEPYLTPYLVPNDIPFVHARMPKDCGAFIVVPGGGYGGYSLEIDGTAIAQWLNTLGYQAFILRYRLAPYRAPLQHDDLSRAIRYVRAHAEEFGIDPNKIGAIGSSAGGHLVASVATHFDNGKDGDAIDAISNRLNFAVLLYPVITSDAEYRHDGSFRNLLGDTPTEEQLRYWSPEKQVTSETPPTFLAHATDDMAVVLENSLLYVQACKDHNVPVELHVYPYGGHGFSLSLNNPHTAHWKEDCARWLKIYGK